MKRLKQILKIGLALVVLVIIALVSILLIDAWNTSYLKVKNHSETKRNTYIIKDVNIIPMTSDTVLTNTSIKIVHGKIEQIGKHIDTVDMEVIDAKGAYLSPGLMDMHVHVWDKCELGLYLANGVTTIRNMWGMPQHLRIKKEVEQDKLLSPVFLTSSPKLTGKEDLGDDKVQISTPEEARQLVTEYEKRGYNFIKTYAGLPEDLEKAILEQSLIDDIPIVSHPSHEIPYLQQFHPQIKSLEHAEEIVQQALDYHLDSIGLETVIQKFAKTQTSFCPTLVGYYKIFEMLNQSETIMQSEQVHYMNPLIQISDSQVQYERWKNQKENDSSITAYILKQHQFHKYCIKKMNEEGVNMICGTDAGIGITAPGFSIHEELALYKSAELSNYEALKTATINPTRSHQILKNVGSIEQGKLANFILTSKNPLMDLSALKDPEWVMIKGHLIDKNLMEELKEKARDRKNLFATAIRYAEYMFIER
ncbi:MAG: amidohydrolase family protein [Bacteroidales bacterium]|nr:amidohydrolase family protein [Bacteroidales bacterium]